jgi:hypothetical protein
MARFSEEMYFTRNVCFDFLYNSVSNIPQPVQCIDCGLYTPDTGVRPGKGKTFFLHRMKTDLGVNAASWARCVNAPPYGAKRPDREANHPRQPSNNINP